MKAENEAQKAFAVLFKACPRLDAVTVSMANSIHLTTTQHMKSFQRAMMHPFGDTTKYYTGVLALQSLLLGAHEAGRKLSTLAVAPLSHAFFELPDDVAAKVYTVIRGLTCLNVVLASVFDDDYGEILLRVYQRMMYDLRHKNIPELLRHTPKLTVLSIDAPSVWSAEALPVPLRDVLGTVHLPCLQILCLRWFVCSTSELSRTLLAHGPTLQRLELVSLDASEGTWESFFEGIGGKLPELRSVRLRDQFAERGDAGIIFQDFDTVPHEIHPAVKRFTQAMEKFVLDGKGELPDQVNMEEHDDGDDWDDWDEEELEGLEDELDDIEDGLEDLQDEEDEEIEEPGFGGADGDIRGSRCLIRTTMR